MKKRKRKRQSADPFADDKATQDLHELLEARRAMDPDAAAQGIAEAMRQQMITASPSISAAMGGAMGKILTASTAGPVQLGTMTQAQWQKQTGIQTHFPSAFTAKPAQPERYMNVVQYCPTCRGYEMSTWVCETTEERWEHRPRYVLPTVNEPIFQDLYELVKIETVVDQFRCGRGHVFNVPIETPRAAKPAPVT